MEILLQVVGLGLVLGMFLVFLRPRVPVLAMQLSLAAAAFLLFLVLDHMLPLLTLIDDLGARAGLNRFYIQTVFRVVGMAYVTELGANVCRDAGESALAAQVELAGRVFILIMAVPLILAVLEILSRVLG